MSTLAPGTLSTSITAIIESLGYVQSRVVGGFTPYSLGSGTLDLAGQPLAIADGVGVLGPSGSPVLFPATDTPSFGTYPLIQDATGTAYSNTGGNSYAIGGRFTDGSGNTLQPGAPITVVGTQGNTYVLRIFYPEDGFYPDDTPQPDVLLERQPPLQIPGTNAPGSSGLNWDGIRLDASYPTHTWDVPGVGAQTFYAYQDPGVLDYGNALRTTNSNATAIFQPGLQRSMITQITITFSGIVDSVDAGAITLQAIYLTPTSAPDGIYVAQAVPLVYNSTPTRAGNRSQVIINFLGDSTPSTATSGPTTYQRSYDGVVALSNGLYTLSINGSTSGPSIHSLGNDGLATTATMDTGFSASLSPSVAGTVTDNALESANKVDSFFVLYGDVYGKGTVTGNDGQWEIFDHGSAPADNGAMNLLPYYTSTNLYLFGTLPGVTQAQYQSNFFLPEYIATNQGTTAGWDPDVVYYDTLGIGYVTLAETELITSAIGMTLPILPSNNQFN